MFHLTIESVATDDAVSNRHLWPVNVAAAKTEDDSAAKIFVMQLAPPGEEFADSLSCVASAIQMTDLPEDEPLDSGPFYRVSSFTKNMRSAKSSVEFIEKIQEAVQDLADNITAAETLDEVVELTITPT